jgi:sulfide:quinone oxidoreductase
MLEPKVVVPDKFAIMPQPSPDDVEALASQGYRSIINNRPDNESSGQPRAADVRAAAKEHGLHYEHMPVALASITPEDVYAFRESYIMAPHPVVAHCASGKRSYLLWAAGEVVDGDGSVQELSEKAKSLGFEVPELKDLVSRVSEQES